MSSAMRTSKGTISTVEVGSEKDGHTVTRHFVTLLFLVTSTYISVLELSIWNEYPVKNLINRTYHHIASHSDFIHWFHFFFPRRSHDLSVGKVWSKCKHLNLSSLVHKSYNPFPHLQACSFFCRYLNCLSTVDLACWIAAEAEDQNAKYVQMYEWALCSRHLRASSCFDFLLAIIILADG